VLIRARNQPLAAFRSLSCTPAYQNRRQVGKVY
jgi:hypothetical protein